jgi:hypothetical protein
MLLIPGFRQGLNASLTSWRVSLFQSSPSFAWDRTLRSLALKAENQKDARALAFVATRLTSRRDAARAANRAVELEPNLTWVYYVVLLQHRVLPPTNLQELRTWSTKLKEWDSENAAPFLFEAESQRGDLPGVVIRNETWRTALVAATRAPRFDDYIRRQIDSDRDVVQRYGLWDPLLFIKGFPDVRVFPDLLSSRMLRNDGALSRYIQQLPNGWGDPPISASFVRIASFMIPGSFGLLIIGVLWRRRLETIGLAGAVSLFVGAAMLCIAYSPHFHRFIANGDPSILMSIKALHGYGFPTSVTARPMLMHSLQIAAIVLISVSWIVHMTLQTRRRGQNSTQILPKCFRDSS